MLYKSQIEFIISILICQIPLFKVVHPKIFLFTHLLVDSILFLSDSFSLWVKNEFFVAFLSSLHIFIEFWEELKKIKICCLIMGNSNIFTISLLLCILVHIGFSLLIIPLFSLFFLLSFLLLHCPFLFQYCLSFVFIVFILNSSVMIGVIMIKMTIEHHLLIFYLLMTQKFITLLSLLFNCFFVWLF